MCPTSSTITTSLAAFALQAPQASCGWSNNAAEGPSNHPRTYPRERKIPRPVERLLDNTKSLNICALFQCGTNVCSMPARELCLLAGQITPIHPAANVTVFDRAPLDGTAINDRDPPTIRGNAANDRPRGIRPGPYVQDVIGGHPDDAVALLRQIGGEPRAPRPARID